jgi:phosphoglycerate kinase
MNKQTVRDVELTGKRVLVRVDFNVPLDGDRVTDDTRVRAAIPTLKYILEQKPAALILMSHLGRPKGEAKPEFSLKPVVPVLSDLLGVEAAFADDCIGPKAQEAVSALPEGGVLLLENTRFHGEEKKNDADFAAELAKLGDIYVNDAFGSAHRAHASTEGVTQHLPAVAGFLLEKEIEFLSNALSNPERPFVAILGGAKVGDKIGVIEALLDKVDTLVIGGGMANTFRKAEGREMGKSLVDADAVDTAKALMEKAGDKLKFPVDVTVADDFSNDANTQVIAIEETGVPAEWEILDIGPKAIAEFEAILRDARMVVWNGPVGVFEMEKFAKGTREIARILGEITEQGAKTIIGGGDSAAAVKQAGLAEKMTHISTGGGASLELLEGKVLPGLAALNDRA